MPIRGKSFARLQFRLTLFLILVFFAFLVAYNSYSLISGHPKLIEDRAHYAYSLSRSHLSDSITIYDGNVASNIIRSLENDPLIHAAIIKDIDGIILSSFQRGRYSDGSFLEGLYDRLAFNEGFTFTIHRAGVEPTEELGVLVLKISSYKLFLDEAVLLPISVIQATAWTLLIISIVSLVIYVSIAKPITALSDAVEGIDLERGVTVDLSKIRQNASHEVQVLCATLDSALEQINNTLEKKETQVRDFKVLSETDHMTGILNRRSFFSILESDIRDGRHFSIIYLDIDHFKRINDTYGHSAGDFVICRTVEIIKLELRDTDRLARIGGEEFAIQVPTTNAALVAQVAERIRIQVAANTVPHKGKALAVTVSLGACIGGPGRTSVEQVCMAADDALYEAKRSGRNRLCIQRLNAA